MSDEDLQKSLDAMRSVAEHATASPEAAREFLIKMGYIRPEGGLTADYQPKPERPSVLSA